MISILVIYIGNAHALVYAISILVISKWTMSVYEVILVHQYGDLLQSLSSLSSSNKAIHSFGFGARSYVCMSMLAIMDNDISFFAGQIIYAVLYGVTSAAYVLLTTLVGLLSCGDIMIHTSRFW